MNLTEILILTKLGIICLKLVVSSVVLVALDIQLSFLLRVTN